MVLIADVENLHSEVVVRGIDQHKFKEGKQTRQVNQKGIVHPARCPPCTQYK
jgi:hypothetical protein